jgi:hypothetical protein
MLHAIHTIFWDPSLGRLEHQHAYIAATSTSLAQPTRVAHTTWKSQMPPG